MNNKTRASALAGRTASRPRARSTLRRNLSPTVTTSIRAGAVVRAGRPSPSGACSAFGVGAGRAPPQPVLGTSPAAWNTVVPAHALPARPPRRCRRPVGFSAARARHPRDAAASRRFFFFFFFFCPLLGSVTYCSARARRARGTSGYKYQSGGGARALFALAHLPEGMARSLLTTCRGGCTARVAGQLRRPRRGCHGAAVARGGCVLRRRSRNDGAVAGALADLRDRGGAHRGARARLHDGDARESARAPAAADCGPDWD